MQVLQKKLSAIPIEAMLHLNSCNKFRNALTQQNDYAYDWRRSLPRSGQEVYSLGSEQFEGEMLEVGVVCNCSYLLI